MKNTATAIFILVAMCAGTFTTARAQTIRPDSSHTKRDYWLSFGFGAASNAQSISGMINNVGASYELSNHRIISLNAQGDLGQDADYTPAHVSNISTFDILGGKLLTGNNTVVTLSAGLGMVHLRSYDRTNVPTNLVYNETNRFSLDIPISVQTYVVGFRAVGIGLGVYANLNLLQPVAGVNINYAFGRINTKHPGMNFLHPARSGSDSTTIPHCTWGSIGFGATNANDAWGRFDLNVEVPRHWLLTASIAGNGAEHIGYGPNHIVNLATFDALAGKIYKHNNYLLSASAGLAYVRFSGYDTNGIPNVTLNQFNEHTIGVPVLLQAYLVGFQTIGIGIGAYANFNNLQTEAGFSIGIAFGRMTTHR